MENATVAPKVIAIMGVPGTGKTTLACHLAAALHGVPIVSADIVKAFMLASNPDDAETDTVSYQAWRLVGEHTLDSIEEGLTKHSYPIFRKCVEVVNVLARKHSIIVVEGVHVLPKFLPDFRPYTITPIIMTNQNLEVAFRIKSKHRLNNENPWHSNTHTLQCIQKYFLDEVLSLDGALQIDFSSGIANNVQMVMSYVL